MLDGADNDCNGWIDYGYPPDIDPDAWKTQGNRQYPDSYKELRPEYGSKVKVDVSVHNSSGAPVSNASVTFVFNTEYDSDDGRDKALSRNYWSFTTDANGNLNTTYPVYLNKGFTYEIHVVPPSETSLKYKIVPLFEVRRFDDSTNELNVDITLLTSPEAENCNSDCTWGNSGICNPACAGYNGCEMSSELIEFCDGKTANTLYESGGLKYLCCSGPILLGDYKLSSRITAPDWTSIVLTEQVRLALYGKPVKMKMVLFK